MESRIIPVYTARDVDAVLVTDTDFKPGVYNLWKSILALLGLNCVFWDISWYQTYSIEDVPWIGKHCLVIFTLWLDDNSLADWLMNVLPHHVRALGGPKGIQNAGGKGSAIRHSPPSPRHCSWVSPNSIPNTPRRRLSLRSVASFCRIRPLVIEDKGCVALECLLKLVPRERSCA